jgi:cystathionine gamma-synthase
VWGGEDENLCAGATQVPVVHSVAFGYPDVDQWQRVALGQARGHIYSRNTNPTVEAFERKVMALERAAAATSFATGMAAISNTMFALLAPGDRVVSIKDSYGGTNKLFTEFLPRYDVQATLCDTEDYDGIEGAVAGGCAMLYLESPTNPTLKITDIRRLSATPINQNPLALGADIVVHSATKFLGGHADALGGVICGSAELVQRVYHYREINGATLHPSAAYLLLRGLKTLHLRIRQQNASAQRIAEYLSRHSGVGAVFYPGLPSHRHHDVAARQMRGFGGVLSFMLDGGFDQVREFLPRLRLAHRAANLGSVETVVGPPATTSHVENTAAERAALGIPEGLVRYSVGIEDTDDLIADLQQALG